METQQRKLTPAALVVGAIALLLVTLFGVNAVQKWSAERTAQGAENARVANVAARRAQAFAENVAGLTAKADAAEAAGNPAGVVNALKPWRDQLDAMMLERLDRATAATDEQMKAVEREVAEAKLRKFQDDAEAQAAAETKAVASLVEQHAAESRIGKKPARSPLDGSYYEVEDYLERVAHDPGSIDMDGCSEATETAAGWSVRCNYRGKNALGALVRKSSTFVIADGSVVSASD